MRKLLFLSILTCLSVAVLAQRYVKPRSYWSTNLLFSGTVFYGDLGGKDNVGTNDFLDVDIPSTRYSTGVELQYNHKSGLGLVAGGFHARFYGDDGQTSWDRQLRNIVVRTDVFEVYTKLEYSIPFQYPMGGLYFNGGVGFHYFNPMGNYNGQWYDLQPLGTEGQVVDPNMEPYKKISPVIPFGFGKKFLFQNGIVVAVDFSFRKSYTDYLDDVSDVYYDQSVIAAEQGEVAAYFANPSNVEGIGEPGSKRGNPNNNDTYFLLGARIHIPMSYFSGRSYNMNTSCSFGNNWFSNGSAMRVGRRGRARSRIFR